MAVFPICILSVLIVALATSAVGFYKYAYFTSIGYGLAICGAGLTIACLFSGMISFPTFMCAFLLMLYGLRSTAFLIYREFKSQAYRNRITKASAMPIYAKIIVWLVLSIAYTFMVLPVLYRAYNGGEYGIFTIIGMFVMIAGLIVETVAEVERTLAKKANADGYVHTGLYQYMQCPNYFGTILFWFGTLISGIGGVFGVGQWLFCILGFLFVLYLTLARTKRMEIRRAEVYSNQEGYQEYARTTPLFIPFVPLYSLKTFKWIA